MEHSPSRKRGYRYATNKLKVIIRDDSPFIHLQEPVRHRVVEIALTDEQIELLRLNYTGNVGDTEHFEEISMIISEERNGKQ